MKSWLNATSLWIYLIGLGCTLFSCAPSRFLVEELPLQADLEQSRTVSRTELEYNHGAFGLPVQVVKAELERKWDSLSQAGVDSILVLCKSGNSSWNNRGLWEFRRGHFQRSALVPISSSDIGFIFWVSEGSYAVQKVSAFKTFQVVRRCSHDHAPLYDFYFRNRDSLTHQALLDTFPDGGRYAYEPPRHQPQGVDGFKTSWMHFQCGSDDFSMAFDPAHYQPQPLVGMQANDERIANGISHYYSNQMLKHWIWLKLIESELLELELTGRWH